MVHVVDVDPTWSLSDYASISELAEPVRALRVEASMLAPTLRDITVWMVNSTAQGGGVAEMLPRMVSILNELGVRAKWAVIGSDRPEFFRLTKRIHNLIHGEGDPALTADDRELYEDVNRRNADAFASMVGPDDIIVVHDPQPLALGAMLEQRMGLRTVWRCHIGHDRHLPATRAAWMFLQPYAVTYSRAVFSAPEYIPDYLAGRAAVIHPALDPCSHKNRELSPHKLVGILCNAKLTVERHPVITSPFAASAKRLRGDGTFAPALGDDEVGFLYRPIVTQVSRWDRLKGFRPLLEGFVELKRSKDGTGGSESEVRRRRRLELVRLVLAGPDPASIQDDPEAQEVLEGLCSDYSSLSPEIQADVALLTLPMESRKENALMVNALQRCSTIIVQNSLREGFGLTATEAMWKSVPVMGTRALGLRQQIRSGIDGVLTQDAEEPAEIARRLEDLLRDMSKRHYLATNARQRVHAEFLVFTQLCHWLRLLSAVATAPRRGPA